MIKSLVLVLALSSLVYADGINKPKRKRHITRHVEKVVDKPKPKLPSLLETRGQYANFIQPRPLLPLLDLPPVKLEHLTTTETDVRTFEFEDDHHHPWAWLLLGAVAIPFLLHDHDVSTPVGASVPVPPQSVPEASTLMLGVGLGLLALRRRK
jgi:hypothetical protein